MREIVGKGGSHVGLVLSFVVFVSFLIFVFSFLNPAFEAEQDKQLNLDLLKINFIEFVSSDLNVTSLKVLDSYTYMENCFEIENFAQGRNSVIRDEEDNFREGYSVGEQIRVIHLGEKFFRVYNSEHFNSSSEVLTCDSLAFGNYTLGSTRSIEYVFEGLINSTLQRYEQDYEGLKKDLGLGEGAEFGFSFIDSNGTEIERGFEIETSGNIYLEEIPIQYYDLEANIKSGFIRIRSW